MTKNEPDRPPPPESGGCEGPYEFSLDRVADSGNIDKANALVIGDEVRIDRDPQGRPAVFVGADLVGWPSTYEALLDECMQKGYVYTGRVVTRRGYPAFPIVEVSVKGKL